MDQRPLFHSDDPTYVALYASVVTATLSAFKALHGTPPSTT